jgi:hypothetical protein
MKYDGVFKLYADGCPSSVRFFNVKADSFESAKMLVWLYLIDFVENVPFPFGSRLMVESWENINDVVSYVWNMFFDTYGNLKTG